MVSVDERFWSKVNKTETCWLWTASTVRGYGSFGANGVVVRAHRWSYERIVGPVQPGLQLDHLCRIRRCVNPAHLEPVAQATNVRRGNGGKNWRDKTHCPSGHEYTQGNVRYYRNSRHCRECGRLACAKSRARIAATAASSSNRPESVGEAVSAHSPVDTDFAGQ